VSYARDQVYAIAKDHAVGEEIEPGSIDDDRLHEALNQVEDDRAHAEAEKLRNEAKLHEHDAVDTKGRERDAYLRTAGVLVYAAGLVDPYEERDGQLVRKSDGKPVNL
jgi:hypothetical protein